MNIFRVFFSGVFSVLNVSAPAMLYRYPYRTSAEGLHGDWGRIGDDIRTVSNQLNHYEKRERKEKGRTNG
jgi:hypothetical protein